MRLNRNLVILLITLSFQYHFVNGQESSAAANSNPNPVQPSSSLPSSLPGLNNGASGSVQSSGQLPASGMPPLPASQGSGQPQANGMPPSTSFPVNSGSGGLDPMNTSSGSSSSSSVSGAQQGTVLPPSQTVVFSGPPTTFQQNQQVSGGGQSGQPTPSQQVGSNNAPVTSVNHHPHPHPQLLNSSISHNPTQLCFGTSQDMNFTAHWAKHNEPSGGWFKVIGNTVAYQHFANLLMADPNPGTLGDPMCLRVQLDSAGHGGSGLTRWTFMGNMNNPTKDNSYAKASCSGNWCNYHLESDGIAHREDNDVNVYVIKHDEEKKYFILVYCYANGDLGWSVNSFSPSLSHRTNAEIEQFIQNGLGQRSQFDKSVVSIFDEQMCEPQ